MPAMLRWTAAACMLGLVATTRPADLEEAFNREVYSKVMRTSGRGRDGQVLGFGEGCQPLLSKCTQALAFAPAGWSPDPVALGTDSAKCSLEMCTCAGPPAAFDIALQVCNVGDDLLDTSDIVNSTTTRYPHATCSQVEGCLNTPCDINAWKKYTTGLAACDSMWYCMKHQLADDLATCAGEVTLDKDSASCAQAAVCQHKQASYDTMPEGVVDCQFEYSKVFEDTDNQKQIDTKCADLACSCMRRGTAGECNGETTCCVNGNPWDTSVVADGKVTYEMMDCEEVGVCLPAVTYCKLVQEPELLMPAECKGYALEQYTIWASTRSTCQAKAEIFTQGGKCPTGAGNTCELISAASLAKCNTIPHMYQTCSPGTEVHGITGECVCTNVSQHVTTCAASGGCLHTPLPGTHCSVEANCSSHASHAEIDSTGSCRCTCTGSWSGPSCDTSDEFPVALVCIITGCALAFCAVVALAVYCVKRRSRKSNEPSLNEQLLEMKGKDIIIELPPSNPTSASTGVKEEALILPSGTPTPTMASLSLPTSANPTPVMLPVAAPTVMHQHPMMPAVSQFAQPMQAVNMSVMSSVAAPASAASAPMTPVLVPAVPQLRSTPKTPPEAGGVQREWGQLKPVEKTGSGYKPHRRRSSTVLSVTPEKRRRTPSPALSAALSIATNEQRARRGSKGKRRSSSKISVGEPVVIKKRRSRTPPPRSKLDDADITRALAELTSDIHRTKPRRHRSNTTTHAYSPLAPSRRGPPSTFTVNKMTL